MDVWHPRYRDHGSLVMFSGQMTLFAFWLRSLIEFAPNELSGNGDGVCFRVMPHDGASAMDPVAARPIRSTQSALVAAPKSSNTGGESSWHIERDEEGIQAGRNSPTDRAFWTGQQCEIRNPGR